jgi:hypothetical protein
MKRRRFNPNDDETIICRRALLNTVAAGPSPVEQTIALAGQQFGLTRSEVLMAARYWNLTTEERDGVLYWIKPDVLAAFPKWNYSRKADRAAAIA